MPNYELKAQILNEKPEMILLRKQYTRQFNDLCSKRGSVKNWTDEELDSVSYLDRQFNLLANEERLEIDRMINADAYRRKHLRKRIESMFDSGNVVFLTLTFNDNVITNTSSQSRRDYVRKYLKSISKQYVGNIDFGSKNGREHYHAVLLTDVQDFSGWTYGFYKAENVRKEGVDALRVAKYISKLTNHAIKETTKRNALIYSR